MVQEIIISIIVSIDILLFAVSCSSEGIKLPVSSAAVINLICSGILGISLYASSFLSKYISPGICRSAGALILLSIGVFTVSKSFARNILRRLSDKGELRFRAGRENIVLRLYLDDTAADIDGSKTLSAAEAAAMAAASSLDCAATGISCGLSGISPAWTAVLTFIIGMAAVISGNIIGKKISSLDRDMSWTGGILLIIFSVFEYFQIS